MYWQYQDKDGGVNWNISGKESSTDEDRFSSVADKEKVHSNLRNLQGKTDFNGISLNDDYIYSERMIIKEFAKNAREESSKEEVNSDYVWRVRGNPKNGLTIKRMKKISQDKQMKSSH